MKNMMKKITALLLALLMCFTLSACSADKEETENVKESTTAVGGAQGQTTDGKTTENETTENETTEALTTEPSTTQSQEEYEDVTAPSEPEINVPSDESDGIKPILYKVSDEKGNVIWLFGSIHVGREEFYPLPDYVMDAYNSSDAVAAEFNIIEYQGDLLTQVFSMSDLVYKDGTKISDHISEESYNAGVAALEEYGIYTSIMDYCCPVLWSTLIDSMIMLEIGVDATLGIDMSILTMADEEGKEIYEIESADFQYSMLAGFSDELQEVMLLSSIASMGNLEAYGEDMNMLLDLWASGDEEAFSEYLNSSDESEGIPKELYDEYYKAMITDRNNNMTEYAVEALASGEEIFICVGAAHVIGDGAMAENLRELGYTVEVVS